MIVVSPLQRAWRALLRGGLLVILGALTLSPAHAAYKATLSGTVPNNSVSQQVYSDLSRCLGYEFDTWQHLQACFQSSSVPENVQTQGTCQSRTASYTFFEKNSSNQCVSTTTSSFQYCYYSGPGTVASFTGDQPALNATSTGAIRLNPTWIKRTGSQSFMYQDNACTTKNNLAVYLSLAFNVTFTRNSNPGGNEPSGTQKVCRVPLSWAVMFPNPPAPENGYLPLPKGTTGQISVNDAYTRGVRCNASGCINDWTPGMIEPVSFPQFGENAQCWFGRKRIYYDTKAGKQIWDVEVVNEQPSTPTNMEIVVTAPRIRARTDVSKPLVPYGTKPSQDGYAYASANWCKAEAASRGEQKAVPSCKDEVQRDIAAMVAAEWANQPTAYVHPAPDKLARDNPDCTSNFDPRCAWSPSSDPIDPQTQKKEELLRLSNDGQNIVINNINVYNNTQYPPSMVNAGTAPAPGSQPGDIGNPANPGSEGDGTDTGDGEDASVAGFMACAEDPTNCSEFVTPSDVAGIADASGAVGEAFGDGDTLASSLVHDAVGDGTCTPDKIHENYCQAIAAFAGLSARQVDTSGNFVWFRGQVMNRVQTGYIPGAIMNFLALCLAIGTYWACFKIALRGHA